MGHKPFYRVKTPNLVLTLLTVLFSGTVVSSSGRSDMIKIGIGPLDNVDYTKCANFFKSRPISNTREKYILTSEGEIQVSNTVNFTINENDSIELEGREQKVIIYKDPKGHLRKVETINGKKIQTNYFSVKNGQCVLTRREYANEGGGLLPRIFSSHQILADLSLCKEIDRAIKMSKPQDNSICPISNNNIKRHIIPKVREAIKKRGHFKISKKDHSLNEIARIVLGVGNNDLQSAALGYIIREKCKIRPPFSYLRTMCSNVVMALYKQKKNPSCLKKGNPNNSASYQTYLAVSNSIPGQIQKSELPVIDESKNGNISGLSHSELLGLFKNYDKEKLGTSEKASSQQRPFFTPPYRSEKEPYGDALVSLAYVLQERCNKAGLKPFIDDPDLWDTFLTEKNDGENKQNSSSLN